MADELRPWIVAVGASGGEGLHDIRELLGALPSSLPAIVLVVLHRMWDRPSHLRNVLARYSALPVVVAVDGARLNVGTVYIGEPSEHLTLASNYFGKLVEDSDRRHGGHTVDLLFKSVANFANNRMIGVVLSGSLDDGSRGLAAIKLAGGVTMVLTPASRPWSGMPENAIKFDGPIDLIGSAAEIARRISVICMLRNS